MAIEHYEGHKSRTNLPLGNDNYLFAFALNARFGPGMQLVGAFGRHQNVTETCCRCLVEVPLIVLSLTLHVNARLNRMSKPRSLRTWMIREANSKGAENDR